MYTVDGKYILFCFFCTSHRTDTMEFIFYQGLSSMHKWNVLNAICSYLPVGRFTSLRFGLQLRHHHHHHHCYRGLLKLNPKFTLLKGSSKQQNCWNINLTLFYLKGYSIYWIHCSLFILSAELYSFYSL